MVRHSVQSMSWVLCCSPLHLEQLQKYADVQCLPNMVRKHMQQYLELGYTIIPDFFSAEEVDLTFKECNYHTLTRGVDLRDASTWENVKGQHDWKQGWAKWLFSTGAQVCLIVHHMC